MINEYKTNSKQEGDNLVATMTKNHRAIHDAITSENKRLMGDTKVPAELEQLLESWEVESSEVYLGVTNKKSKVGANRFFNGNARSYVHLLRKFDGKDYVRVFYVPGIMDTYDIDEAGNSLCFRRSRGIRSAPQSQRIVAFIPTANQLDYPEHPTGKSYLKKYTREEAISAGAESYPIKTFDIAIYEPTINSRHQQPEFIICGEKIIRKNGGQIKHDKEGPGRIEILVRGNLHTYSYPLLI